MEICQCCKEKSKKKLASVFANLSSGNGNNKENADPNSANKNKKRSFTEMTCNKYESVNDESDLKKRKLCNDIQRDFSNCTFSNCTFKFK